MVSATTWPEPAVEFVVALQPPLGSVSVQVADEEAGPVGGPRAPVAPLTVFGPSVPIAELCTRPAHAAEPAAQVRVADALDQLEAPGTVGAPFAPAPGEPDPAGGVAGWDPPEPVPAGLSPPLPEPGRAWAVVCPEPPMPEEVSVALELDGAATRGAIFEASGPADAPELVTAWQPPVAPWQEPVAVEPLGFGETSGSVPVAVLDTLPVQLWPVSQLSAAPEAEAADGPDEAPLVSLLGSPPAR
jgi:hypothetical protein